MDLHDSLERIYDLDSFLEFVALLVADREEDSRAQAHDRIARFGAGPNGWQNHSIEDFLDAALRWTEDTRGREMGLPDQASWQALATFLYVGKIYE